MLCPARQRHKIAKVLTVRRPRILIEKCYFFFLELSRVRNRGTEPADEIRPLVLLPIMFHQDNQLLPLVVGGGIVQFANPKPI